MSQFFAENVFQWLNQLQSYFWITKNTFSTCPWEKVIGRLQIIFRKPQVSADTMPFLTNLPQTGEQNWKLRSLPCLPLLVMPIASASWEMWSIPEGESLRDFLATTKELLNIYLAWEIIGANHLTSEYHNCLHCWIHGDWTVDFKRQPRNRLLKLQ